MNDKKLIFDIDMLIYFVFNCIIILNLIGKDNNMSNGVTSIIVAIIGAISLILAALIKKDGTTIKNTEETCNSIKTDTTSLVESNKQIVNVSTDNKEKMITLVSNVSTVETNVKKLIDDMNYKKGLREGNRNTVDLLNSLVNNVHNDLNRKNELAKENYKLIKKNGELQEEIKYLRKIITKQKNIIQQYEPKDIKNEELDDVKKQTRHKGISM